MNKPNLYSPFILTKSTGLFLFIFISSCLALFSPQTQAQAQTKEKETIRDKRFIFSIGAYFAEVDSTIALNSKTSLPGTRVNFEEDLGLERYDVALWSNFNWRLNDRHGLVFEYFKLPRNGNVETSREWQFNDTTVKAGARMDSNFSVSLARFSYTYSFLNNDKHELRLLLGLHMSRMKANVYLSGNLEINGRAVFVLPDEPIVESGTTEAPLPHGGFEYNYSFSPAWVASVSLIGFRLKYDRYYGRLLEFNAALLYNFNESFAIGGGYKSFYLYAEEDKGRFYDVLGNLDFSGPGLFFTASF